MILGDARFFQMRLLMFLSVGTAAFHAKKGRIVHNRHGNKNFHLGGDVIEGY